ncbi:MAG: hypothetical protein Q9203_007185 [Teloschistes exilis]
MGKDEEGYSFAKLKGPENFEQWSNNMRGALLASDLWVFIDDPSSRPEPPELKAKEDDSEERTSAYGNAQNVVSNTLAIAIRVLGRFTANAHLPYNKFSVPIVNTQGESRQVQPNGLRKSYGIQLSSIARKKAGGSNGASSIA